MASARLSVHSTPSSQHQLYAPVGLVVGVAYPKLLLELLFLPLVFADLVELFLSHRFLLVWIDARLAGAPVGGCQSVQTDDRDAEPVRFGHLDVAASAPDSPVVQEGEHVAVRQGGEVDLHAPLPQLLTRQVQLEEVLCDRHRVDDLMAER